MLLHLLPDRLICIEFVVSEIQILLDTTLIAIAHADVVVLNLGIGEAFDVALSILLYK